MAHLWVRQPDQANHWNIVRLAFAGRGYALVDDAMPVRHRNGKTDLPLIVPDCGDRQRELWVLIAGHETGLRINGQLLSGTGIHVLADRDEIVLGNSTRLFFGAEELAAVTPFSAAGAAEPSMCPRCKKAIAEGAAAVRCPQCRVWYHQESDRNCWTYDEVCVMCRHTTALDAGFSWTPQNL